MHIHVIFDKFARLKESENIDDDPDIERRLQWIREDVAFIVEVDRMPLTDRPAR
jgi:hypothetical protein